MPEVTSYAPGAPSWAELDTTDEIGALSFYSALFGWEDDPQEITPGWFYHLQKINGLEASSIYRQSEEELSQNIPSHWNMYFNVNIVDETVETIKQTGGTVVFGPMDVFEAGRMAFCQDPQGAFFAIWQANQHIGARVTGEVGSMCWAELWTTSLNDAMDFYIKVLGMERGEVIENMNYAMLRAGGTEVCGTMEITADMPPDPAPLGCVLRCGGHRGFRGQGRIAGRNNLRSSPRHREGGGAASRRPLRRTSRPAKRAFQHPRRHTPDLGGQLRVDHYAMNPSRRWP